VGDCSDDGQVTIDELLTMVNIVLDTIGIAQCGRGDTDGNRTITVDEVIQAVTVAFSGCPISPAEQGCLSSGGTVAAAACCLSAGDFPDRCALGACGCAPAASHEVLVCTCGVGQCFNGSACVPR